MNRKDSTPEEIRAVRMMADAVERSVRRLINSHPVATLDQVVDYLFWKIEETGGLPEGVRVADLKRIVTNLNVIIEGEDEVNGG